MAARPSWRGQIRLALVAIPVEIFPATKAGRSIAFHQIHEPSGQRVRYEKVVPGIGPVDRDDARFPAIRSSRSRPAKAVHFRVETAYEGNEQDVRP
jgi:hypothetical protein